MSIPFSCALYPPHLTWSQSSVTASSRQVPRCFESTHKPALNIPKRGLAFTLRACTVNQFPSSRLGHHNTTLTRSPIHAPRRFRIIIFVIRSFAPYCVLSRELCLAAHESRRQGKCQEESSERETRHKITKHQQPDFFHSVKRRYSAKRHYRKVFRSVCHFGLSLTVLSKINSVCWQYRVYGRQLNLSRNIKPQNHLPAFARSYRVRNHRAFLYLLCYLLCLPLVDSVSDHQNYRWRAKC